MSMETRRRRVVGLVGAATVGTIVALFPLLRADAVTTASRVSGADRYATAAAVSAQAFAPGVSVVYLATGENFPDALAGAPAAAKGAGPVLLTRTSTLPSSTANELDRLNPGKIIVLGGTNAVSQAVQDQLQQYTAGTVSRIHGADRYETAANLSNATFVAATNTVFVATGANFPDALAGGPAVAQAPLGGPVLLVEPNAIPSSTATELTRLAAQKVVVLGGTSAVSDAVKASLEAYSVDPVVRYAGADRYLTAVDVSMKTFTSAVTKVYLATGENFPDALAAGSPAGVADGPVLLSRRDCIPPEVNAEITRLDPTSLIVVGGTDVLSDAVLNRTVCQPPASTSTPTFPGGSLPTFPTFPGGSLPGFPDPSGSLEFEL